MENERKHRFNEAYDYLIWRHIIKKQGDLAAIMETSRSNISAALSGSERVLTVSFLKRFYHKFHDIFSYEWLMDGQGQMLKDQKSPEPQDPGDTEKAAEISIVSLAATLIQETENLRRQLSDSIEEVSELRAQMSLSLQSIKSLHEELKSERDIIRSIRTQLSSLYIMSPENSLLRAAENTEK